MITLNRHKLFLVLVDIAFVLVILGLVLLIVVNSNLHARIEADIRILSSVRVAQNSTSTGISTPGSTITATPAAIATISATIKAGVIQSTSVPMSTVPMIAARTIPKSNAAVTPLPNPVTAKVIAVTLPAPIAESTSPQIVFRLDNGTRGQIYVIDADGSGLVDLSNDATDDSDPVWSPDHKQIAYTAVSGGHSQIWLMKADGSDRHSISGTNLSDRRPTWSPDGTHIMFLSGKSAPLFCIMAADGSDRRPFKG